MLQEAGLQVPRDVSVVGFDGTELSEGSTPSLTTVQVPFAEIGAAGTKVLIEQINKSHSEQLSLVLPTSLKIGASTAPLISQAGQSSIQERRSPVLSRD